MAWLVDWGQGSRTRLVVMRVVRVRMKVRREMAAVVLRRG